MRKIVFLGPALAGLIVAGPALAAPARPAGRAHAANPVARKTDPTRVPTITTLSALQAQERILAVKVQIAKLEAEIRKANTGSPAHGSHPMSNRVQGTVSRYGYRPRQEFDGLRVRSIIGYPGRLQAILERPGGGSAHVRPGQSVDGLRIVRITPHNVWIAYNGHVLPLPWRDPRTAAGTPDAMATGGFPTLGESPPPSGTTLGLGAP
jgi:type IV pilus biogenesis protein PilP